MQDEHADQDLDLGGGEGSTQGAAAGDDPLAGVPAEPIEDVSGGPDEERLGGEGAAIGEEPAPGEFMEEPEESEAAEVAAEEPPAAPAPDAEEAPVEEPAAAEEEQAAQAAEPEPQQAEDAEPEPPAKPKTKPRHYKVLKIEGKGDKEKISSPLEEPIEARNGDEAIKVAYKTIAKSAEDSMTLVAIPVGYFKPKEVKGRKKEDYAVEVG